MSGEPPRAVLLDALGTLLALDPPAPRLRTELAARCGLKLTAAQAEAAMRVEIAYYRAHHLEGRDAATLASLRARCAETLRGALGPAGRSIPAAALLDALLASLRFIPYPDARLALERLRVRGTRLVVVSNWDVSLHDVLAAGPLGALLDGVVTSAEAGVAKPAVEPFARALALAGVAPEQALHVGDTPALDLAGARAAGIPALLLVRTGPLPAGVDAVRSLTELPGAGPQGGPILP